LVDSEKIARRQRVSLTWSRWRWPRRARGRRCWRYSHSRLSAPDWSYAPWLPAQISYQLTR